MIVYVTVKIDGIPTVTSLEILSSMGISYTASSQEVELTDNDILILFKFINFNISGNIVTINL